MATDDLLQPSLNNSNNRPIYSVGAVFAAAFFGGSVAVCVMAALNANRIKSLTKNMALILGALILSLGVLWYLSESIVPRDDSKVGLVNRGLGFALVGATYLMFRRQYRSMKVLGSEPASPYIAVIAASLIGILSAILIVVYRRIKEGALIDG